MSSPNAPPMVLKRPGSCSSITATPRSASMPRRISVPRSVPRPVPELRINDWPSIAGARRSTGMDSLCPTCTTTLPTLAPRCKSRKAIITACSSKAKPSCGSGCTTPACARAESCRSSMLNQQGSMFQPGRFRLPSSTATATKSTEGRDASERQWLQMLFLPISTNTPRKARSPSETEIKSSESAFTNECKRRPRRRHASSAVHAVASRELDRRPRLHGRSSTCFAMLPAVPNAVARARMAHSTETRPTPPEAAWTSTSCIDRSSA
jgi:hypothetical protein